MLFVFGICDERKFYKKQLSSQSQIKHFDLHKAPYFASCLQLLELFPCFLSSSWCFQSLLSGTWPGRDYQYDLLVTPAPSTHQHSRGSRCHGST